MNVNDPGHDPEHTYVSTSCFHGHHDQCRRICKYCPALCLCKCHGLQPSMHVGGVVIPPDTTIVIEGCAVRPSQDTIPVRQRESSPAERGEPV